MSAELICGDALDVLRTLGSGSIGHVVTDPPYGQTNESYESGVASDPALWRECYRVTGDNAALISFAGSPTYHKIASAIEAAGWKVRQMWGWVYRDGFITSAWPKEGFDRLAPAFDPICFATKGKVLLNLEREGEPWDRLTGRDPGRRSYSEMPYSERSRGRRARRAAGHYPRALAAEVGIDGFTYFALNRTCPSLKGERIGHPNQKPLALLRWLVSKLPNGGLPILDPFAGSGTTLEAARLEGFDSVGIERDTEFHTLARRRIDAALAATPNP